MFPRGLVIASQGAALSAISGPAGDHSFSSVVFLSGFEGVDGGTTVTDESAAAHAVTLGGTAVTSTAVKKFGSSSLSRTATDQSYCANSADWNFGAGSFTIEGWYYFTDVTVTTVSLMSHWTTTGNQRGWYLFWSGTNLVLQVSTTGVGITNKISVPWVPTINTWYHIACDFDGTTYRLYVNGVLIGSAGSPITIFDSTNAMRIGGVQTGTGGGFPGYIDEVRITKGVARYASDAGFTAPAAAFPRS